MCSVHCCVLLPLGSLDDQLVQLNRSFQIMARRLGDRGGSGGNALHACRTAAKQTGQDDDDDDDMTIVPSPRRLVRHTHCTGLLSSPEGITRRSFGANGIARRVPSMDGIASKMESCASSPIYSHCFRVACGISTTTKQKKGTHFCVCWIKPPIRL